MYLFPDNEQSGMLEDLILRSLEKHSLIGCIEKFLDFVKSENFSLKNPAKSRIHAFTVLQSEQYRLGEAVERGYFDLSHGAFKPVINFVTELSR